MKIGFMSECAVDELVCAQQTRRLFRQQPLPAEKLISLLFAFMNEPGTKKYRGISISNFEFCFSIFYRGIEFSGGRGQLGCWWACAYPVAAG